MRIHILGASGSGTTTLGESIARQLNADHLDTDEFYWEQTHIRYSTKRPVGQRLQLIQTIINGSENWVLSGSLCSWGDPLIPHFSHVIFLQTPWAIRKHRLIERERIRYNKDILTEDSPQGRISRDFLQWAERYDTASLEQRSLKTHRAWLDALPQHIKKFELDGSTPLDQLTKQCARLLS